MEYLAPASCIHSVAVLMLCNLPLGSHLQLLCYCVANEILDLKLKLGLEGILHTQTVIHFGPVFAHYLIYSIWDTLPPFLWV